MKKILIPTDFSELGDFAYTVASFIASKTSAEIHALAIVPGPQGAYYSNSGELLNDEGNDYSEWYNKLEEDRKQMTDWVKDKSDITTVHCTIGKIDNEILRYANDHKVDLIVMGTDGVFNKKPWTPGSHTEFITNHADIPVLSLKCDRSDLDLNEMVLVGDYLYAEKINLDVVKTIQHAFSSKLILLKIRTPNEKRRDEEIKTDMEAFAEINDLDHIEMCIYNDDNVEAGIGKFTAERDIDMIILGTHQGKGFSKLFKRSISDDVVNHLYHPILTFPLHN